MTHEQIQDAFALLDSLEFFGIKMGLDQTRVLFERIGNPEQKLKFIHVAGSNGKGSVCAMLESALRAAGFKTGFYSSPHLVRVAERFRINGKPISDEQLAEQILRLRPVLGALANEGMKCTYFEATTALAAMIFAEEGVDYAIWETGLGGRLDATNIVTPELSAITGISLEHTRYLGNTLPAIAREKAGIIKVGVPILCPATLTRVALTEIVHTAEEKRAPLFLSPAPGPLCRILSDDDGTPISQTFLGGEHMISIPLLGPHQRTNAMLAVSILERLNVPWSAMEQGLRNTVWPARFEIHPSLRLILDAGHNPEGIAALAATLRETFPGRKFHFFFGAFSDKETAASLAELAPLAQSFGFIHLDSARDSKQAEQLGMELSAAGFSGRWQAYEVENFPDAFPHDKGWSVVCGSLYLGGAVLDRIRSQTLPEYERNSP